MRMDKITISPTDYQNHIQAQEADDFLKGATHIQSYTKDEKRFGGERTIVIFAFYPDEEK
jgi:hypothetical protein